MCVSLTLTLSTYTFELEGLELLVEVTVGLSVFQLVMEVKVSKWAIFTAFLLVYYFLRIKGRSRCGG